jgi:hypothetical protein
MSEDTRQTPAPTFTAEQLQAAADLIDFQDRGKLSAMLTYAASLQRREDATCEWKEDEDGNWNTSCDEMFTFIDGKPRENYYKFCAHCGRHLVESVYVEPTDDEVQP